MILGLTGSIGSGKTSVVKCLAQLGAIAIQADELAREVVAPGTPALTEIIEEFGTGVLKDDGSLNRQKLAQTVFADPDKRRRLEQIIHPRVHQRECELIAEYRDHPLVVLEIPLLFEVQAETLCDAVLVITVSEDVRRERLMRDRGMSAEEVDARLSSQMPQAEKNRRADFVIDNSGDWEVTRQAVEDLYRQLTAG